MNPVKFIKHPATGDNRSLHVAVDLAHLLDAMTPDTRLELLTMVAEDELLIKAACLAVASKDDIPAIEHNIYHDVRFATWTITEMRLALAPLLPAAAAEELKAAIATASKYKSAFDLLQSLAHIRLLMREDGAGRRREQWELQWQYIDRMFPEYAEQKASAT